VGTLHLAVNLLVFCRLYCAEKQSGHTSLGKKYFFSRAPCILQTTGFFDVDDDQLVFKIGQDTVTII
jgi:hypothetical protein